MLTLDQINRLNGWWTDPAWTPGADPHLVAAAAAEFTWDPRPFDDADLASGAVFTLRGPRQGGKTTLTKRLIAERVAAGLGRRTCFLMLQAIARADELQEAIETVSELRAEYERTRQELAQVNEIMRGLDALRIDAGGSETGRR